MDLMEFLAHTDQRNLKHQIGCMVERRMQELDEDLENRRIKLLMQLQDETLQLDEELAALLQKRAENSERQRLDWINMELMKREQAEEELLKLKQQQLEIENSEAHRHMQTKQLLLDTKRAQLYQIEERKGLREREAFVSKLWQEVWKRLDESKAKQEEYEQKLRCILEGFVQMENQKRHEEQQTKQSEEVLTEQRDYRQAMEWAAENDRQRQKQNLCKTLSKKMKQHGMLQMQIEQNKQLERRKAEKNRLEDIGYNILEDKQIYTELSQKYNARARNREWHQSYMQHKAEEHAAQRLGQIQLNQAYLGTGCVLSQQEKRPYGKDVR